MFFSFPLFQLLIFLVSSLSCFANNEVNIPPSTVDNDCYDFKFSNLNLHFSLINNKIIGSNKMHFDASCFIDTIFVDLFENLNVDSVLFNNHPVTFFRKKNSICIIKNILQKQSFTIEVFFNGAPNHAKNPPWDGGVVIDKDNNNLSWLGMACQKESGAIWFPSKHDLSDEPDSMRIRFNVPKPYSAISNGKLISINEDPEFHNRQIFEWFVNYPINNYNVTFNIADYKNFKDTLLGSKGVLELDYYVLPDNFFFSTRAF